MDFDIWQQPKPEEVEAGGEVKVLCNATAKGKRVSFYFWTDGDGHPMSGYTARQDGVSVLNVSKLETSKEVVCNAQVEVNGQPTTESRNYTVEVAGESCMHACAKKSVFTVACGTCLCKQLM